MNNIKEFLKTLTKRLKVLLFFKQVTWQDKLVHLYSKNKSVIFILLGLIIFVAGVLYIFNRKDDVKKNYSNNDIKQFMNLQAELYYDPINYFVYNEDILLVDIRRKENFQKERISSSINIPVKVDEDNPSEFLNQSELIEAFRKLDSKKTIVVFGENSHSLAPAKLSALLAENNMPVKVMTIGWNEIRHLHTFWLPEQLWGKVNIMEFVESDITNN